MDLSKYHKTVSQIITILKDSDVWFETFEHEPVRTSEEASNLRDGYTLHQGAKALIVRVKITNQDKKFVMLVLPGDARFSSEKVCSLFHAKDVRFATVEEVLSITDGIQPGGVPPFGHLFNVDVYVDPSLLQNEKIVFNAGDKSFSVGMYAKDCVEVVKPVICEFV